MDPGGAGGSTSSSPAWRCGSPACAGLPPERWREEEETERLGSGNQGNMIRGSS